jgi:hypothetical protein
LGQEELKFEPSFDLVISSGLLAHLSGPEYALTWFRTQAPTLFLATNFHDPTNRHFSANAMFQVGSLKAPNGKVFRGLAVHQDQSLVEMGYAPWSFWPDEAGLLELLKDAGYRSVSVLGKDIHQGRPLITVLAES